MAQRCLTPRITKMRADKLVQRLDRIDSAILGVLGDYRVEAERKLTRLKNQRAWAVYELASLQGPVLH